MTEREQILSDVLDEVFGLGPLEPLLRDPTISDILVNTYKQVYVESTACSSACRPASRTTGTCCASSTAS